MIVINKNTKTTKLCYTTKIQKSRNKLKIFRKTIKKLAITMAM